MRTFPSFNTALLVASIVSLAGEARAQADPPMCVPGTPDAVAPLAQLVKNIPVPEVCPLSRPDKNPKHLVFLFEGHTGYSPELATEFRKFQARSPSCVAGRIRYSDGADEDFNTVLNRMHGLVKNSDGGSPVALKNFILHGLCRNGGQSFEDTEVFYYSEEQSLDAALACAEKYAKRSFGSNEAGAPVFPSLALLGFSNGGDRALDMGKELNKRRIRTDVGITVDPVPRGVSGGAVIAAQVLGEPGARSAALYFAPSGTRWLNYWQETDNRFVVGGLHGNTVNGATVNSLVVPPLDPAHAIPNGAHWRIFNAPVVETSISTELSHAAAAADGKTSWSSP